MKRTEIWMVNLDPTIGAEIKKTRPAVIVSDDAIGTLPLKVIVPVTDWKTAFSNVVWMVQLTPNPVNNLRKPSAADCFQVRSVSQNRMIRKIGEVSDATMQEIEIALAKVLKI